MRVIDTICQPIERTGGMPSDSHRRLVLEMAARVASGVNLVGADTPQIDRMADAVVNLTRKVIDRLYAEVPE